MGELANAHDFADLTGAEPLLGAEPELVDQARLLSSTDAMVWAEEFHKVYPECDQGTMIGWFANAMMTMHDEGRMRAARAIAEHLEGMKPLLEEFGYRADVPAEVVDDPEPDFHSILSDLMTAIHQTEEYTGRSTGIGWNEGWALFDAAQRAKRALAMRTVAPENKGEQSVSAMRHMDGREWTAEELADQQARFEAHRYPTEADVERPMDGRHRAQARSDNLRAKDLKIKVLEGIITSKRHRIAELEEIRRFERVTEQGLAKALQDIFGTRWEVVDTVDSTPVHDVLVQMRMLAEQITQVRTIAAEALVEYTRRLGPRP